MSLLSFLKPVNWISAWLPDIALVFIAKPLQTLCLYLSLEAYMLQEVPFLHFSSLYHSKDLHGTFLITAAEECFPYQMVS